MNSVRLSACLMGLLVGCAGASLRGARPVPTVGHDAADGMRAVVRGPAESLLRPCGEGVLYVELVKLAELSLGEFAGEGAHTGAGAGGPLWAVTDMLPPGWRLTGWVPLSGLCADTDPGGAGFAVLHLPALPGIVSHPYKATRGLLLAQGPASPEAAFLASVDPERLVRDVLGVGPPTAGQRGPLRLRLPLGAQPPVIRSMRRTRAPRLILLPGPDEGPAYERPFGTALLEDELESRFRLPVDAGTVLIWRF